MSSVDLIYKLKDIHIPQAISYWPPAPGWWILLGLNFLIIIFLGLFFLRRYKRFKLKKEALKILEDIQNNFEKNNNDTESLKRLSILIRRIALTFYSREEIASLQGLDWLNFLDKSGKTEDFSKGLGVIFGEEIYKKNNKIHSQSLFLIVRKWINVITKKTK
tara:strand:- start:306 stop:791 length:486 start_codon:yes stop_codon:yes gene_type:complete